VSKYTICSLYITDVKYVFFLTELTMTWHYFVSFIQSNIPARCVCNYRYYFIKMQIMSYYDDNVSFTLCSDDRSLCNLVDLYSTTCNKQCSCKHFLSSLMKSLLQFCTHINEQRQL